MIRIEQKDLQPNVEYYLECSPNYYIDNEPSKFRCILMHHYSDENNNLLQSFFRDVKPINPEK